MTIDKAFRCAGCGKPMRMTPAVRDAIQKGYCRKEKWTCGQCWQTPQKKN